MRRKALSTSSSRRGDADDYLPGMVVVAHGIKILHRNLTEMSLSQLRMSAGYLELMMINNRLVVFDRDERQSVPACW